jgi:nitroreductase
VLSSKLLSISVKKNLLQKEFYIRDAAPGFLFIDTENIHIFIKRRINSTIKLIIMKTRLLIVTAFLLVTAAISGQGSGNAVTDAILKGYSVRAYTSEPVSDQQLDFILKCGIKSPSSRNQQPWKFTVIRDETSMKEIIKETLPGNVLIVISGVESQSGTTPDFDCGLATESMFVAAEGLGLGARIYGSPVATVIKNREAYQIPAGFKPVIVLRIGNIDKTVDAVSAASARKTSGEIVNFKK